MSVTEVKFMDDGQTGKQTGDASSVNRELTTTLKVSCSSKADLPDTVFEYLRTHTGVPYNGRLYNVNGRRNTGMYCENMDIRRMPKSGGGSNTNGIDYMVVANFKQITGGTEFPVKKMDINGKPTGDPYLWRDEITTSDYTVQVPAESGTFRGYYPANVGGNKLALNVVGPVTNSAFQRFDPPPEREVSVDVLRITKTTSTVFPHLYMRYKGSLNNDNVTIIKGFYGLVYRFGPYQGQIKSIDNVFDIANGIPYWRQTLELHINPLGWLRFLLDQGDDELFGAEEVMDGVSVSNSDVGARGYIKKRVLDPRGNPVRGLLDGNGHLLQKGKPPVFLIWQLDNALPFSGINW